MNRITEILDKWYFQHKRDLPWRRTKSAYEIWLSEIILQQTRVNQGLQYYNRLLERFPDVRDLAKASLEEVLKLWQGLGYYTRARNLHETARKIVSHFGGSFPADYKALLSLKGIGEYTAAAIASMAFDIPVALVDGNVYRVLSRLYAIRLPGTTPRGKREIQRLAQRILNQKDPGSHNQALMELGALICLPGNPSCDVCPVQSHCQAYKKNLVSELPVKTVRVKIRKRYFNYLCITLAEKLFLHQRTQKDIWHSLFEFPLIETTRTLSPDKLFEHPQWKRMFNGSQYIVRHISPYYIHKLTHQILYVRFYHLQIEKATSSLAKDYICTESKRISEYPVSRLTEKYLTTFHKR